jgi:hypothetical protein
MVWSGAVNAREVDRLDIVASVMPTTVPGRYGITALA